MGDGGGDERVHGFVVDGYAAATTEGKAVGDVERDEGFMLDMEMVFPAGGWGFLGDRGSFYDLFHKAVMGVEDSATQARRNRQ